MLCTNLANEVKALREQILGYQQFEESANEQLEELANNLTISTKEIDEKTNALTVAMMEVEVYMYFRVNVIFIRVATESGHYGNEARW